MIVKQVEELWKRVEDIDRTNYLAWFFDGTLLTLQIDRNLYKHFPFKGLRRRDFKVELMKDGKRAEIYVYCRGTLHTEYDKEYLEKLGALLEQNNFEVTAYLLEDC